MNTYFNPKRAAAILFAVLLIHIGIIVVPIIYATLTNYFHPPVIVMKVGVAELPLGDAPDAAPVDTAPAPVATKTEPTPVDDIPDPTKVAPLPDLPPSPPPEQKKTEVAPPKKDTPKTEPQKTEPKKDPPKTEPKKTEPKKDPPKTEPKKTEQKKDPPKTEQKKDQPKSTYLKPEDIIKPKSAKTQAEIDAERKAAREAEAARQKAERARNDALADLRNSLQNPGKTGIPNPGREGVLQTKEMRAYYDQLVAYITPQWNSVSPSSVELNGKITEWPSVDLTITKDGRVSKADFVKPCGNKKVDDAVRTLLANLKVVPVPPQAGVIRVTLDIR